MTAAVVVLASALAGALAVIAWLVYRLAAAVRSEAAADRETTDALRLADSYRVERDAEREDRIRAESERDIARAVVGATRTAAVVAAEETARATATAAAADSPDALAARVDELLARPFAGAGAGAAAAGGGGAGPAAVPAAAAAGADDAGARPGA